MKKTLTLYPSTPYSSSTTSGARIRKHLLRKNMEKVLPEAIAWRRKKIGFNAPVEQWLPDQAKILTVINNSDIILTLFKKPIKVIPDRNLEWRLFNLAVWQKIFNMELL